MLSDSFFLEFDLFMRKYCDYVYPYYDNPLSDDEIKEYMEMLSIRDVDFLRLYQWKNGISIDKLDYGVHTEILMQGNFLSLKDILVMEKDNLEENYWSKKSLKPILANYEGEYLLIETDITSSRFNGIYFYSSNLSYAVEPVSYFDSIETMLKSIIRLFELEIITYDNEYRAIKIDFELSGKICRELNPLSDCWKMNS